jgi:hypothetical protein
MALIRQRSRSSQATRVWRAAVALALFALPAELIAGDDDGFLLDNEAAMTGGAVVAVTDDSGAVWYNPAALGGNRHSISLGAVVRSPEISFYTWVAEPI